MVKSGARLSNMSVDKQSKHLNKPWRTLRGPKKYAVVVNDPETGKRKLVRFGDPLMDDFLKHKDLVRRKSFRARQKCDTDPYAKDKTRPKYWVCNWSW